MVYCRHGVLAQAVCLGNGCERILCLWVLEPEGSDTCTTEGIHPYTAPVSMSVHALSSAAHEQTLCVITR